VPSMVRIKKVDSGRDRVFKTEDSVNMKEQLSIYENHLASNEIKIVDNSK
jgi:hypothetical protein